ncbi:aminotransferase [Halolactibacillus miurensis]|uniref:Aminotransferase n=1 Tax=Halolactibacillus miurensis TaxID=306541 RepID=A0A1I6UNR5_9BACI|nr:aminotransferase [Halolactibacillus miurensis]GEM05402.1 aminotransferase [Halolactibacillus miurensis]SFT03092.1 aminotransferase [Halolactibacillus miurensis]
MSERFIAEHIKTLKPSGIRRFFDLAQSMEGVISLGVGEPDFTTPWSVIEASYHSLERGFTAYTPNAGLLTLRQSISRFLDTRFQVRYQPEDEVIVTVGASQSIDLAFRAILNPGDEVIVMEPSFVSYIPTITLAGGVPVIVDTYEKDAFKLSKEAVEAAITEKTKAILICSPNNPTGAVLSREDLIGISDVIKGHDLLVISDEIYADLLYDDTYTSMASMEGMKERTLLVSGFSKAFAMTGWRLGYVCGPKDLIAQMLKIHQYTIMSAPTMAQYGAIEALENGLSEVEMMKESYKQRRNYVVKALTRMGLSCHVPGGAFYVFPSIKSTGLSSSDFAEQLLMEEKVAVVPGSVFGDSGEGYIRCSYAASMKQLTEAMDRISRFLDKLKAKE